MYSLAAQLFTVKPMNSQSLSPTRVSQKARGTCQVCRLERKLHDKDGRVYRHGPRDGPCRGSHKPPLKTLSPSGLIDRDPPLDTPDMPKLEGTLLRSSLICNLRSYQN